MAAVTADQTTQAKAQGTVQATAGGPDGADGAQLAAFDAAVAADERIEPRDWMTVA